MRRQLHLPYIAGQDEDGTWVAEAALTPEDLQAVALTLNNRPRKVLGWKTPAEAFAEQLRSIQQAGVASTG